MKTNMERDDAPIPEDMKNPIKTPMDVKDLFMLGGQLLLLYAISYN